MNSNQSLHVTPKSLFKFIPVFALICGFASTAQAQPVANPAAAQRAVEQGLQQLRDPVRPLTPPTAPIPTAPSEEAQPDFAKLDKVVANVPSQFKGLEQSINKYWSDFIGKPVRGSQINEFKAWIWDELVRLGYLGFVEVTVTDEPTGGVINVDVKSPKIGRVTVVDIDSQNVTDRYAQIISQRLARTYTADSIVDVKDIEAQLDAMAYDLPVDLQVQLRRGDEGAIDVLVDVKRIDSEPGSINSAILQFNTYGLSAYGREQVLGVIRVEGPRPLSEFVGIAEVSRGMVYLRGEYSQPIEGYASRWNVYATGSRTQADTNIGNSSFDQIGLFYGVGGGVTTLLSANRSGTWYSSVEAGYRESRSELRNLVKTRERRDAQLRFGLQSNHSNDWANRLSTSTVLTVGDLSLGSNDISFGQFDAGNIEGLYVKLDHSGNYLQALSADQSWTFSARWRFQVVSQNMDSYNQISLGGVSGIRAFDSDEGVGDQGAQISFDLTKQLTPEVFAGVFYDVGVVQARKTPSTTSYLLQGAGVTLGGNFTDSLSFNLSVAKSFGSTPASPFAITGEIGDWRAFFALTQRF